MRTNLPKEMDFVHEAANAARAVEDFQGIRTPLYIPEVIQATKRVLIMEYIQGGRVDDLAYLAEANIDRNTVAIEISRIFNQMVFINGWFHAVSPLLQSELDVLIFVQDPHPGDW
jgi:aarF domain-containing kinase